MKPKMRKAALAARRSIDRNPKMRELIDRQNRTHKVWLFCDRLDEIEFEIFRRIARKHNVDAWQLEQALCEIDCEDGYEYYEGKPVKR